MRGKQRWAVLHDNNNEAIWADSARSQQCYHMKRPVWAACPVLPRVLGPLHLLSVLRGSYGQVNSMAGRVPHRPKAERQLGGVDQDDGSGDGKQGGQSRERRTCPTSKWMECFKCQVLIWADSKLWREGTSGYAKPSGDDSPAADSDTLTAAGQMWEIMSLWITPAMRNSLNFDISQT